MSFTIILVAVSLLIIMLIVFSVMQQQKRRVEQEQRAEVARLTITVDETENLLSRIANIPVTKSLMMVLHNRIMETQKSIKKVNSDNSLTSQINDRLLLIQQISKTFQSKGLDSFKLPSNDREVLQLVQVLKKLKGTINSEQKRGRINPEVFTNEIKRVDLLQIRVNINSIIKRAKIAVEAKQTGSARTYLEKAIKTLKAINSEGDTFVGERLQEATEMLQKIDQVKIDRQERQRQEQEEKSSTDLDMLFQPKKKW
jgi:hypothetical protein